MTERLKNFRKFFNTYMRCWRGGTGWSRHRDTDRPTRRSPSLTFSSLFLTFHFCSLSLSISCLTYPSVFSPPFPPSCRQYHLSSSCNTHLRAAAAARRASAATLSKVGFDWRMLGLVPHTQMNTAARWYMHVAKEYQCVKGDPAAACPLILFWNWQNLSSYH